MPHKSKLLVSIVFLIIILLVPRAFTKISQTRSMAVVTAIGLDMVEDEIELSAQIIIPKAQAGITENLMAVSAKNKDIASALQDLSTYVGKYIGIEHCNAIVLGDTLSENGVMDALDFFFRGNKIDHNTILLHFDGKAKDLLTQTAQIDNSFSLTLDELTKFSGEHFSSYETDIEQFFSEYYSSNKISLVGSMKIDDSEYGLTLSGDSGASGSQGDSQGSSSGQSSSGSQSSNSEKGKYLHIIGETVVYDKGKKVLTLNQEETTKLNWVVPEAKKYYLKIENVNDSFYDNATVIFSIDNKLIYYKTKFEGDAPIIEFDVRVDLLFENIIGGDKEKLKNINETKITPLLRSKIINKIHTDINDIVKKSKTENIDFLHLYNKFEKFNYNKLNSLVEEKGLDYFYSNLVPKVNVVIHEKY